MSRIVNTVLGILFACILCAIGGCNPQALHEFNQALAELNASVEQGIAQNRAMQGGTPGLYTTPPGPAPNTLPPPRFSPPSPPLQPHALQPAPPAPAPRREVIVRVNVYKLFNMPLLWHTGTVIGGKEYYFHSNSRVEKTTPGTFSPHFHRTIERRVTIDPALAYQRVEEVIRRWHNTRYDVFSHNCNYFTQDILRAIGAGSLDREYIESSGASRVMAVIPGSSTLQEIIVKGSTGDLRAKGIAVAMWDDARKVWMPPAIVNNVPGGKAIDKAGNDVGNKIGRAGENVGNAVGGVTNPVKKLFGGK